MTHDYLYVTTSFTESRMSECMRDLSRESTPFESETEAGSGNIKNHDLHFHRVTKR